jgi:hypothetical protein
MRAKAAMFGLVLGAVGWLGTGSVVVGAPMAPAKQVLAIKTEVEHVGNHTARAHKALPARAMVRKASRAALAHRLKKAVERTRQARKGHLERFARHNGPRAANLNKSERQAHLKKGDRRAHFSRDERRAQVDRRPVDLNKHHKREVGDWSRHHTNHETRHQANTERRHHVHKDQTKDTWKDHFRRKKDKDGNDARHSQDGKKTRVTYLGSIDHDKKSHDGEDRYDYEYDNDNGYDRRKKRDRYYFGRGVYVDDSNNNNNDEEDENSESGDKEEKTAEDNGYRNCEKGRDCDVKMKWIRVPVQKKEVEEVPLK